MAAPASISCVEDGDGEAVQFPNLARRPGFHGAEAAMGPSDGALVVEEEHEVEERGEEGGGAREKGARV